MMKTFRIPGLPTFALQMSELCHFYSTETAPKIVKNRGKPWSSQSKLPKTSGGFSLFFSMCEPSNKTDLPLHAIATHSRMVRNWVFRVLGSLRSLGSPGPLGVSQSQTLMCTFLTHHTLPHGRAPKRSQKKRTQKKNGGARKKKEVDEEN